MKINRKGCTRIVLEFENIVIKIPNFLNAWEHFLKGIIGNIEENNTWKYNSGEFESGLSYLLCPVKWCSIGGWILVMEKVDEVLNYDNKHLWDYNEHVRYFKGDDTPHNYGILKGKVVKIDYAELDHF